MLEIDNDLLVEPFNDLILFLLMLEIDNDLPSKYKFLLSK